MSQVGERDRHMRDIVLDNEVIRVSQSTVPQPVERGHVRFILGGLYFSFKRHIQWYFSTSNYATERIDRKVGEAEFSHVIAAHESPTIRKLRHVGMQMENNKIKNLQLAIGRLNGLVLRPGETMSLWRLVRRPSKRKGYLPGMVLINGEVRYGYGGGLCQLSNLIYWMTLHTELTVTERFRHQYDVFPDSNRTVPFGSGATIAYNYIDLQIRNDTNDDHYLTLNLTPTHLVGEWRCTIPTRFQYEIVEKNHCITQHRSGKYLRNNEIWRRKCNDEGVLVEEACVAENHALMMYSPLLSPPCN